MMAPGLCVLVVLPGFPFDPASGAARSVRTICEMLADAGATVRVLATMRSEGVHSNISRILDELEIGATIIRLGVDTLATIEYRGVHYELVDVESSSKTFDCVFDNELATFRPHVVFGYGGELADRLRFARAQAAGARVVFALRNEFYLTPAGCELLRSVDAAITPSQYLTDLYRSEGVDSSPLPLPIDSNDVIAPHSGRYFTFVNPSAEKGAVVTARLLEELSIAAPGIPLLVVDSRGSFDRLARMGRKAGFDLRRHANIISRPMTAYPRNIYQDARAVLVPSLWREAAGRVVAESLLNGIPPLVSNRGGLEETCNGAGFVLPIPLDVQMSARVPVSYDVVSPWVRLVMRLAEDSAFYLEASQQAIEASVRYRDETTAAEYVDFFTRVAAAGKAA